MLPTELPAQRARSSVGVLVAANLLPFAGVVWWGWQVGDVVFLYWAENLVIGAFNVLRMAIAQGKEGAESLAGRIGIMAFFIVHYGGFCYGHGVFLAHLFPPGGMEADQEPFPVLVAMLGDGFTLIALAAVAVSHGFSWAWNYVGRGEYRRADINALMGAPYKRILVTHVFILVGGFALMAIGSPLAAILVFVVVKTGFDAQAHWKEHRDPAAQ